MAGDLGGKLGEVGEAKGDLELVLGGGGGGTLLPAIRFWMSSELLSGIGGLATVLLSL